MVALIVRSFNLQSLRTILEKIGNWFSEEALVLYLCLFLTKLTYLLKYCGHTHTPLTILCIMQNFRIRIVSSIESQFSVLNGLRLSRGSASKINRAQRLSNLTSFNNCLFEQFPQTIRQYPGKGFTSVLQLCNNFSAGDSEVFLARFNSKNMELTLRSRSSKSCPNINVGPKLSS